MIDLARLNICFIAGTLGQGGAERQLYYILQALCRCGAQTRLLCLTQGEFWEDHIRALGVPVVWIGRHPSKTARLVHLVRLLRQEPPHLLQSQHFFANLYAMLAATLCGIPAIGALRTDGVEEVRSLGAVLGSLSLHLPPYVAANSQAAIREAIGRRVTSDRLHFLPNVIDTQHFKPRPGATGDPLRILSVGRLVPQKRQDRLLRLVARLQAQWPGRFRVSIAGDGPLRGPLEKQARELRLLPDVVEFVGVIPDTASLYQASDLLLLTSDWEGTPNVILEAMASGLPVVATNVGGIPDVVQQGATGYLADPDDDAGLMEALNRLIQEPALCTRIGEQAHAYVTAHHALDRLPDYLRALYTKVLA
jgi:glycosyltransferase involved in cell wall biosynthesis